MRIRFVRILCIAAIMAAGVFMAPVGQAVAGFYENKVITIVIPFGPGGGYHLHSSKLSQHIRQFIPDSPPIVLQFMPGAGGLKGANYFYSVAPSQGTHIALLSQTAALFQRLNKGKKGYRYDASKLNYIGRLVSMDAAHMFFKSLPSRDLETLKGSSPGTIITCTAGKAAQGYMNAKAFAAASGLKIKILTGYQGSRRQNLAMQQGECNYQPGAWNSWKARLGDWIDKKWVKPIALTAPQRHPDIPDVPTIIELAKTPELKRIMSFIAGYAAVGRAFSSPPGTPKARVAMLRGAFDKTVNSRAFKKEAADQNMLLGPETGQFVQNVVDGIINAPDDVVNETKKRLGYK